MHKECYATIYFEYVVNPVILKQKWVVFQIYDAITTRRWWLCHKKVQKNSNFIVYNAPSKSFFLLFLLFLFEELS